MSQAEQVEAASARSWTTRGWSGSSAAARASWWSRCPATRSSAPCAPSSWPSSRCRSRRSSCATRTRTTRRSTATCCAATCACPASPTRSTGRGRLRHRSGAAGRGRRAYLDQILGVVLDAADGAFNELLALGFLESMKREWAWRVSRGESTRNLQAFAHLLDRRRGPDARPTTGRRRRSAARRRELPAGAGAGRVLDFPP